MNITARHLTKVYKGGVYAVNDFSIQIADGEFVTMLGPSGCGKTTLLRLFSGLEKPTAGELYFDGVFYSDLPLKKRDTAMVFQDYVLYPSMTVWENVATALQRYGLSREEESKLVYDALSEMGLLNVRNQLPRALSGGQQQRVALARAIVKKPSLMLFDEPLSGSADEQKREYVNLLRNLKAQMPQTTFVYVTHRFDEAFNLGTKLLVMSEGRVLRYGEKRLVWENPHYAEVLRILGCDVEFETTVKDGFAQLPSGEQLLLPDFDGKVTIIENKYDNNRPYAFSDMGESLNGEKETYFFDGYFDGKTVGFGGVTFQVDEEFRNRLADASLGNVDVGIDSSAFRTSRLSGDISISAEKKENFFELAKRNIVLADVKNFEGYFYVAKKDINLYRNGIKIISTYPIRRISCVATATVGFVKTPAGKIAANITEKGKVSVSFNSKAVVKSVKRGGLRAECIAEERVSDNLKRAFFAINGFDGYVTLYAPVGEVLFPNGKLRLEVLPDGIDISKI